MESENARPFIISIVGDGSNCGKTALAVALMTRLQRTASVGALKIATATDDRLCGRTGRPCHCLRFDGEHTLHDEVATLARPGKDTQRFLATGARPVWWLQTTREHALTAARDNIDSFRGPRILVAEGSALARAGLSDRLIAVRREDREPKEGFEELAATADLRLVSGREFDPADPVIDEGWLAALGVPNP